MAVTRLVSESVQAAAVYVTDNSHIDNYILTANVAKAITKPTDGNYVLFSSDGDFWVRYGATAGSGSTDLTDGSGSELNPIVREVRNVTSISVIATSTRKISCLWYK